MNTKYFALKLYPVRDKRLVEKKIYPTRRIPLGMQPLEHNIAYLRQAAGLLENFFYQDHIPNGITSRTLNIRYCLNT
jgi:hypothetical protein